MTIKPITIKPRRDRIRLWVRALRTGGYLQGVGALHNGHDAYCCLGVACEVYREATGEGKWTSQYDDPPRFIGVDTQSDTELPIEVSDWFGLTINPILDGENSASDLNDEHGWDFERIAEAIEEKFLKS